MSPAARMILRCLLSTAVGTIPGIAIVFAWRPAPGIGIAAIGALVGLLMGAFRISPGRVGRLTLGVMAAYNLGGADDRIFEKLDETSEGDQQKPGHDLFQTWLLADGIRRRRGWLVVTGLVTGLLAGATCTYLDVQRINAGGSGLLLPLPGTRDPLITQAIVATLGCIILGRRSVWPVCVGGLSSTRRPWHCRLWIPQPVNWIRCQRTQCRFATGLCRVLFNGGDCCGADHRLGQWCGMR